jgi:hypothetical protein
MTWVFFALTIGLDGVARKPMRLSQAELVELRMEPPGCLNWSSDVCGPPNRTRGAARVFHHKEIRMNRHTPIIFALVTALVLLLATYLGRSTATAMQQGVTPPAVVNNEGLIFPAMRIIRFDDQIARFDTATGELRRFTGTVSGGAANGTWVRLVRPVTGGTSGFLSIRVVGAGTFLVDDVTGDTWVLRRASGAIGTWAPINETWWQTISRSQSDAGFFRFDVFFLGVISDDDAGVSALASLFAAVVFVAGGGFFFW